MRLTPRRLVLAGFYVGLLLCASMVVMRLRRQEASPKVHTAGQQTAVQGQAEPAPSSFLERKEGGSYPASLQERNFRIRLGGPASRTDARSCRMDLCFNFSRCEGDFKVYLYPVPHVGSDRTSPNFDKFVKSLQRSKYSTDDPEKACLFVPIVDVLDRDALSPGHILTKVQVDTALGSSPHWNGGLNNLIFNLFSGTFPNYSEFLDFDTGKAILAKASLSLHSYRPNFDVSLPLIGKGHPQRSGVPSSLQTKGNLFPLRRKYLLTFKGKRYVYGVGSETRNILSYLHNGKDSVLLTTCEHGTSWAAAQDWRCTADNMLYRRYDYQDLMVNSTFCVVPRGRRLGSYRLLEVMQAGCIPVSLSNAYVLPFQEVIDWGKAALVIDERAVVQLPFLVRAVPKDRVFEMRLQLSLLWDRYFSTVQSIVDTTLEIIHQRVKPHLVRNQQMWNRYPGGLAYDTTYGTSLRDFPFLSPHLVQPSAEAGYTVVIRASMEVTPSSPLSQLISSLGKCWRLKKVVVVWGGKESMPQRLKLPLLPVPLLSVHQPHSKNAVPLWPIDDILTSAVMTLDEAVKVIAQEIEFAFDVWYHHQSQIVGFYSLSHSRNEAMNKWSLSSEHAEGYSLVHTGAAMFHRYYCHLYASSLPAQAYTMLLEHPPCEDVALNFLVSQITKKPPVLIPKLPPTTAAERAYKEGLGQGLQEKEECLNKLVDMFGELPLQLSILRMTPALYKTPAAKWRKLYPHLEGAQ